MDNSEPPVENYILTKENILTINPLIGLTEEDINSIFGNDNQIETDA